jgi:hypothetical protein
MQRALIFLSDKCGAKLVGRFIEHGGFFFTLTSREGTTLSPYTPTFKTEEEAYIWFDGYLTAKDEFNWPKESEIKKM